MTFVADALLGWMYDKLEGATSGARVSRGTQIGFLL